MHALESLENDLKRELPSKEMTALMKSFVNSVYGVPMVNQAKHRESKCSNCNVVFMDEFVTENNSCIGKRCSDGNS